MAHPLFDYFVLVSDLDESNIARNGVIEQILTTSRVDQ